MSVMIGSCFAEWGDVALLSTRLTVLVVGAAVLFVTGRQLVRSYRGIDLGVVPRPVWWFTFSWATAWTMIASVILFTCSGLSSTALLALYGASFAWVSGGLLTIVWIGIRQLETVAAETRKLKDTVSTVLPTTNNEAL